MNEEILKQLITHLNGLSGINAQDLPSLDLYMDQVTSFMEEKLAANKRYPDDKILTKTMINNYTKNKLLPPPDRKRYTKDHLLFLIYIYYLKNILQLDDIKSILGPLSACTSGEASKTLQQDIYDEIFSHASDLKAELVHDLEEKFRMTPSLFSEDSPAFRTLSQENREYLQLFSLFCFLGYDVYIKKLLMEQIVDRIRDRH